ncbi:MAG: AraC family transcriptional regulator [Verrucomicrobia bacterium]|nr:AraC family transcriptional regulator [Verrucomicrobiota bacterium]
MRKVKSQSTNLPELSWLSEVKESRQPLSELFPVWVRHGRNLSGPALPYPEWHPYFEFSILLEGRTIAFVEREQTERIAGDLFIVGPGVPHWVRITKYPATFVAIYFLPSVMIDLGPQSAGPAILHRFAAQQSLKDRLVRTPPVLRRKLTQLFKEAVAEFENNWFGREMRLRTILVEQLVELLRWEERIGRKVNDASLEVDWRRISKSLQYVGENYTKPIYAQDMARAAGMSESRMKILFQNALGVSWVKYLQGYRIHRAIALLSESRTNITEAAFATGFESVSHFNAIFRSFMGVSPSEYRKERLQKKSV